MAVNWADSSDTLISAKRVSKSRTALYAERRPADGNREGDSIGLRLYVHIISVYEGMY